MDSHCSQSIPANSAVLLEIRDTLTLNSGNMTNQTEVKLSKWAYAACFLGDAVLLGLAVVIFLQRSSGGLTSVQAGLMVVCGLAGGVLAVLPFLFEYNASVSMVETGATLTMIAQLEHLEELAGNIKHATSQWQSVQESATHTATLGKEIADKMMGEVSSFMKFMQEANDGEKSTMRLEIDKLRRGEHEFIQIIVRMLDHTFALHQAAIRSGQPSLIEQLGQFQSACRDVARRVGLAPYLPSVNDIFDPALHQSADSQTMPVSNARISEVVASGYTYQGAMLRPALVSLQNQSGAIANEISNESGAGKPSEKAIEKEVARSTIHTGSATAPTNTPESHSQGSIAEEQTLL